MLKPLLFILLIVTLSALALNLECFSQTKENTPIVETKIIIKKPIELAIVKEVSTTPTVSKTTLIENDALEKELKKLLIQAQKLFRQNKDLEAISLYEKIIEKSKKSKKIKILKLFSEASFKKANIHYFYPNYDIDSAIETYEIIVKQLKKQKNKDLLLDYMKANIAKARLESKEEMIIAYDEIIEKFQKDKEARFTKEIEELLFAKSFALMGSDDEEAMEVLDSIIASYDDKTKLPETVKYSILNNIELSIITNNDAQTYVDMANKYMADSPDTEPLLEMLNIIKDAQELDQTEALDLWNSKHANYNFPDWDFSELRKWVHKMETPEAQSRIRQYLDIFEQQKYKSLYPNLSLTSPSKKHVSYAEINPNSDSN